MQDSAVWLWLAQPSCSKVAPMSRMKEMGAGQQLLSSTSHPWQRPCSLATGQAVWARLPPSPSCCPAYKATLGVLTYSVPLP